MKTDLSSATIAQVVEAILRIHFGHETAGKGGNICGGLSRGYSPRWRGDIRQPAVCRKLSIAASRFSLSLATAETGSVMITPCDGTKMSGWASKTRSRLSLSSLTGTSIRVPDAARRGAPEA